LAVEMNLDLGLVIDGNEIQAPASFDGSFLP
jgi:hypothetical protein